MKNFKGARPQKPHFSIDSWQLKACPPFWMTTLLVTAIVLLAGIFGALTASAATKDLKSKDSFMNSMNITGATTVLSATVTSPPISLLPTRKVWITAYSSTEDQTDDTPFITASGKLVRDGIVATNLFPFGTRIKIPSLFGEKVFIVEDRMHRRKTNNVDIWMPSTRKALIFGIIATDIIILGQEPELLTQR